MVLYPCAITDELCSVLGLSGHSMGVLSILKSRKLRPLAVSQAMEYINLYQLLIKKSVTI